MFERLESMLKRYKELEILISDPAIIADQVEWRKLVKEHASLDNAVQLYKQYLTMMENLDNLFEMMNDISDKEMALLAKEEYYDELKQKDEMISNLKIALLPVNPDDDKNVVIEIRPAAGGDEAALFGAQLTRMYIRYAERKRWKVKEVDMEYTDLGGIKEVTFILSGIGAYSQLKFESGVHRVQRIPETESQGRVHTSTVTVAVLPEIEEVEFEILDKDLKIDTYRSGGAGGQHVNKTESAIRITHLPTGLVVTCQDEKSQIKNKESALKVLKTRLYDYYQSSINQEYSAARKLQVGTGDRSERIRTYNFPQGRITDHRIGFTMYNLSEFLDGDIFEMLEALAIENQNKLLENFQNNSY